ncbi:MAG TPA: hypothetical protein VKZ77_10540 [Bacillaceae bacterium]|nr:hypothetical protein [Paenibacillus bovis]HLU22902.1 hypothetical protein [Bacillaceae bacterium]
MKRQVSEREYIYIYMNDSDHFILSSGIEFHEFMAGIPIQIHNILLLKHRFEESHFNMHTFLEYADKELIDKLLAEDVYGYGDFCWIDFTNEENVNLLNGQEIAELLYLGHMKSHLHIPFYGKLNNQFAYLAGDDGHFNKVYYRHWDHFISMLGSTIAGKVNNQKEKSLFPIRKKKMVHPIPKEILMPFIDHMKEGMVISIENMLKNRSVIEIPVWIIGDLIDMDQMYDEYEQLNESRKPDGKIVFDRKTEKWEAYIPSKI